MWINIHIYGAYFSCILSSSFARSSGAGKGGGAGRDEGADDDGGTVRTRLAAAGTPGRPGPIPPGRYPDSGCSQKTGSSPYR